MELHCLFQGVEAVKDPSAYYMPALWRERGISKPPFIQLHHAHQIIFYLALYLVII